MMTKHIIIRLPKLPRKQNSVECIVEQSISLNILFVVYFVFVLAAYLIETGRFLNFYNSIAAMIVTPLVAVLAFFIFAYRFKALDIYIPELNTADILALLLLLGYFLLKLPFPDINYDTRNYHLYLQEKSFSDLGGQGFLPIGRYSTFYSLGDSVFYLFRTIFGYRLGTIANLLILFVIYFNLKEIFALIFDNQAPNQHSFIPTTPNSRKLLSSGLAFLTISLEYVLANLSIYMIDLIFLPFLLQIFKYTLQKETSNEEIDLSALLIGLSIGVKITTVIYGAPLLLILLLKNPKNWTIKRILSIALWAAIPLGIYITYNLQVTGSPMYFLYNEIFKSPYYWLKNFKDTRYGPTSWRGALIYPFKLLNSRSLSVDLALYSGRLTIGWLFPWILLFLTVVSKKLRTELLLLSGYMVMLYLWVVSTGYLRYAEFLELICIPVIVLVLVGLQQVYRENWVKTLLGVFIILTCYQAIDAHKIILINNFDWSQRPSLIRYINQGKLSEFAQEYLQNSRLILKDRPPYLNDKDIGLIAKVDVWYSPLLASGMNVLLKKDAPQITDQASFLSPALQAARINAIQQQPILYTATDSFSMGFAINGFNQDGLFIHKVDFIYPNFLMNGQPLFLFQLTRQPHANTAVNFNSLSPYKIEFDPNSTTFDALFFLNVFQTPPVPVAVPAELKISVGGQQYHWSADKGDLVPVHIDLPKAPNAATELTLEISGADNIPAYGVLLNPEFSK